MVYYIKCSRFTIISIYQYKMGNMFFSISVFAFFYFVTIHTYNNRLSAVYTSYRSAFFQFTTIHSISACRLQPFS